MKKMFIFIFILIIILVGGLYGLLFTPFGNSLLKPIIEAKINEKLPQKITLQTFKLSPKSLDLLIKVDKDSKIEAKGDYSLFKQTFNINYLVDVRNLSKIAPLIGIKLKGPFKTKGVVKGDKEQLNIIGVSDIAKSDTKYSLILQDFKPKNAKVSIKSARLSRLLYMLSQPIYADALIDVDANFDDLEDINDIKGSVKTLVKNGKTFPKVLYKEFNLTNANIGFSANSNTNILNSIAKTKLNIDSTVAKISVKKATYNIEKNIFISDYTLYVPNLDKLYFATKKHLRGDIKVVGDVKKDKDLLVNAHSDTLGGKIDAKLLNNNFSGKIKDIRFTKLTDMLIYPRVFESSMNANINYNLLTKKGTISAKLLDGRILPNRFSFLLNQMAHFDITKEIYKVTKVDSKINNKVLTSNLDMESRLTHISSKDALLDMNRNFVDAKLQVDIINKPVYVKIKGDINKPKITLDVKSMIKEKAKQKIKEKLEKKIPSKFKEPVKQLLNLF